MGGGSFHPIDGGGGHPKKVSLVQKHQIFNKIDTFDNQSVVTPAFRMRMHSAIGVSAVDIDAAS